MSQTRNISLILATGLAMFSMFFGAGNVTFPLKVGEFAKNQNIWAICGLLITAVGVPFMGLISISLYDGNYKKFFGRLGQIPGFLIALVIMALIGPFGAIPRCIALSYSTTARFFPNVPINEFCLIACLVIFLLALRKNRIVDILGYFLTPILLGSLIVIIFKGFLYSTPATPAPITPSESFLTGLKEGYQTMDLLGAFFFSSIVIGCLKQNPEVRDDPDPKKLLSLMIQSSFIGAALLSLIYVGFSFVASFNAAYLEQAASDQLIVEIALKVLGPYAGPIACVAVALACLTTAIALSCIFAEFVHYDLTLGKVGYVLALIITLFISYFISVLNFSEIVKYLTPILQVLYPALIVLSIVNLKHKFMKPVRN